MTMPAEPPPTAPMTCWLCKGPTEELPPPPGVAMPLLQVRICPKCDRLR